MSIIDKKNASFESILNIIPEKEVISTIMQNLK